MSWSLLTVALALAAGCAGAYILLWVPESAASKRIAARLDDYGRKRRDEDSSARGARRRGLLHRTRPFHVFNRMRLLANWRVGRREAFIVALAAFMVASVADAVVGTAAGAPAFLACLAAPLLCMNRRANRNRQRFIQNLPSLLDRVRQLLVSGNSLFAAFDRALADSDPIVRAYLEPAAIRLAHGVNLPEALLLQAQRLGIPEISVLALVARANLRFGGSLADVLDRMAGLLRDRVRAQREYEALTAEIRTSSKVLFLLPVLVMGGIFVLKPEYVTFFTDERIGQILGGYAVASAVIGGLVLKRLQLIRF